MLIGLVTFVGIAADTGLMQFQKSRIQTAADAGLTAALSEKKRGVTENDKLLQAANYATTKNGFANGVGGVTVTFEPTPSSGPYAGQSGWMGLTVSQVQPTYFMRMVGQNSVIISARAVARAGAAVGDGCVFALDPTMSGAFNLNGNGVFNACGVQVNSNSTSAVTTSGNTWTINAASFKVVGNVSSTANPTWVNGPPTPNSPSLPDPLAYLVPPPAGDCSAHPSQISYTGNSGSKQATINPGTYCGGLKITSGWTVTFNPGVYVINGGGIWGGGNIKGTGVTIYNTCDASHAYLAISIAGSTDDTLTAPTSGPYEGILMFQDHWSSCIPAYSVANSFNGASNFKLDGALYFKTQALTIGGTSSWHYTSVVADSFSISGNTVFGVLDSATNTYKNDFSQLGNGNPLHFPAGYVFGQ